MTQGEKFRDWALQLRAVLELSGSQQVIVRRDGVEYDYRLGRGLTVSISDSDGRRVETHHLPERALDEERWAVA